MSPCRTCGGDRAAPEPDPRLGFVRYIGAHPEPSITFPVPCPGRAVYAFEGDSEQFPWVGSHRNEVVALPNRRWMRVSVWAAVFLAGARQRHGPWVEVRLSPQAWREVQTRAPWLRKASDALRLMNPGFLEGFRRCEVNSYEVVP